MFGWEFPPFNTGGLGTACYGLTKSLAKQNCRVKFVLPKMPRSVDAEYVDLVSADMVEKIDFEKEQFFDFVKNIIEQKPFGLGAFGRVSIKTCDMPYYRKIS